MQCFTYKSKLPKTETQVSFREWPTSALKRPKKSLISPDWTGRMWIPDAMPYRPFINVPEILYHPKDGSYRESKMPLMLDHINKVNWTTSGKVQIMKRTKPNSETMKYSMDSTYRRAYPDPGVKPIKLYKDEIGFRPGALPHCYNVKPYVPAKDHFYVYNMDKLLDEGEVSLRNK